MAGAADPPCWLALLEPGVPPDGATWVPARGLDGHPAGTLAVWRQARRPHAGAARVAPAVVVAPGEAAPDDGPDAWAVSLVAPPRGRMPLFDDPAVVEATRAVMRDPGRASVSTLVVDATHWAGAVTFVDVEVARAWPGWWGSDPYARLAPARRLVVPGGVLRAAPLPAGPGTQRYYGSSWPAGTFA